MNVGERVKNIRKSKGLIQQQLADKCGMFESAIGRMENSKGTPRIKTLNKIAKALNTTPQY